jgi:sugar phosphate isomerase/epimerase
MNTISFMTANFVARQVGYNMEDWGHGDRAVNETFSPLETYAERFEAILNEIRELGFGAIDLWLSHLNYSWATENHIAIAKDLLLKYDLEVVSIAGWLGSTPQEFEASCKIGVAVGAPLLGSTTSMLRKDRAFVIATLKKHNLKLGIENHPEKSVDELLVQIGEDSDGALGATVDTGWFGTQGVDPVRAIEELDDLVFHVHLKDVLEPGEHNTCRYAEGCVPVEACVRALQRTGYWGAISVEHEPEHFNPTADIRAGLQMLRGWLEQPA